MISYFYSLWPNNYPPPSDIPLIPCGFNLKASEGSKKDIAKILPYPVDLDYSSLIHIFSSLFCSHSYELVFVFPTKKTRWQDKNDRSQVRQRQVQLPTAEVNWSSVTLVVASAFKTPTYLTGGFPSQASAQDFCFHSCRRDFWLDLIPVPFAM